jgi:predicted dienelactone hydrolase
MQRGLFVLLVAVLLLAIIAPAQAQRPDAPRYAQRGPYPVGTREFVVADDDRPLDMTVWYPALNPDEVEEQTEYQVLVFALEGRAIRDAAPDVANGPYPVVMFSHGSSGLRYQSRFFTEHLASWGFVVVAADHPGNTTLDAIQDPDGFASKLLDNFAYRPLDVLRQIDYLATLAAGGGVFDGVADMDQIAVSGHSFGGYTALGVAGARLDFSALREWCAGPPALNTVPEALTLPTLTPAQRTLLRAGGCFGLHSPGQRGDTDLATRIEQAEQQIAALRGLDEAPAGLWPATTDPRVKALILMAPWNGPIYGAAGMAEVTVPTMILVGAADRATFPRRDALTIYRDIASQDKSLVVFDNAGHYVFVDECPDLILQFGLYDSCSDDVWDMDRIHDLTNHMTTAFLLSRFYGDADAAAALAGDVIDFRGVQYLAAAGN